MMMMMMIHRLNKKSRNLLKPKYTCTTWGGTNWNLCLDL